MNASSYGFHLGSNVKYSVVHVFWTSLESARVC